MVRTSRPYFSSVGKTGRNKRCVWIGVERKGGGRRACKAATNQLTDLISHCLQFVLRATHDDHIQPLPGQLKMKRSSITLQNSITISNAHLQCIAPSYTLRCSRHNWNGRSGMETRESDQQWNVHIRVRLTMEGHRLTTE